MKYIKTLFLCLVALVFNACGDDEPAVNIPDYKTVNISISPDDVASGCEYGMLFEAYASWTLSSDQVWCQLHQGDKQSQSLTGAEGMQSISIVIDPAAATDKAQQANVTLSTGGKTFTMAIVTLGEIVYRGVIKLGDMTYTSDKAQGIHVFDYNKDIITIQANFDYYIEMPEWCLVNGGCSFNGKAGEVYEVEFAFNETLEADKRYKQTGEFVFVGNGVRDVFTITYTGMDKYLAEISLGEKESITPWDWIIDIDNQLYLHKDSHGNVARYEGGVSFTAFCRNDDVQFVHMTQDGDNISFATRVDYAKVEGEKGYYRYSLNGDIPASGRLLAFSTAAWDTIKADPVGCLMEDGEFGHKTLTYKAYNNVVIEWNKLVVNNAPFTIHHNMLYDEGGMLYYNVTKTDAYRNIFGTDNVWEMSIDASNVNLCIVLDGYKNEWFESLRIGFDNKLNIDLEDIAENGSCTLGMDGEVPAFSIYLNSAHRAQLQQGPLYIAVVNPDTREVTGLVVKAKTTK